VGDCTRFPDRRAAQALRLESVQNANDQARTAVATLAGTPKAHDVLPWFWSDQTGLRLQMAGLMPAEGTPGLATVRRPGPGANPNAFSLFHYVDSELMCVESVNAPVDHMMSRKLLEAGKNPDAAAVADVAVPLKSLL
jgi:3-phenylpropionate/trans-cinnamate dioxygenase ferredoxin reductase subunit